MINDLPKKRAKNVKVGPITTAGLKEEVQKLKDAYRLYQGEKKVEKMLKEHHNQKNK
jgi:hypothetical protein